MELELNDFIKEALQKGIFIKVNNEFIRAPGYITLAYNPQIKEFVLVFGNTAQNAGYVLIQNYLKDWKL